METYFYNIDIYQSFVSIQWHQISINDVLAFRFIANIYVIILENNHRKRKKQEEKENLVRWINATSKMVLCKA